MADVSKLRAGYLRVSTNEQADNGLGLEVQRDAIETWAAAHSFTIAAWFSDEGLTGADGADALERRAGLRGAFESVEGGMVGGLVVYRLDRIARDLIGQEVILRELWRMGGQIHSTRSGEDDYLAPDNIADAERTMIRQIFGVVAQYERALIRQRMAAGRARKAANGGYLGGMAPYGYRVDAAGMLHEVESEQQTIERICTMRRDGLSTHAIAARLNAVSAWTRAGGRWTATTVHRVIVRELPAEFHGDLPADPIPAGFLRVGDAAAYLGVSRQRLHVLYQDGRVTRSRDKLYAVTDLDAFLQTRNGAPSSG